MSSLLHSRGDIAGMFIMLFGLLFGLWQIAVAGWRLNGLSLTGYPDRRVASVLLGSAVIAGTGAWYFSRPGHFAAPDIEGMETIVVFALAFLCAAAAQCLLAESIGRFRLLLGAGPDTGGESPGDEVMVSVDGGTVPGTLFEPEGGAGRGALLIHDYGGTRRDMRVIGERMRDRGFTCLSFDLDGHGANSRPMTESGLNELLAAASEQLSGLIRGGEPAAVGYGLGANLAIAFERASRVIALDPLTIAPGGFPQVNSLRELRPLAMFSGLAGRPSRSAGLAMESARRAHANDVWILTPADRWFTDRTAQHLRAFELGPRPPVLVGARHSDMVGDEEVLEEIASILG